MAAGGIVDKSCFCLALPQRLRGPGAAGHRSPGFQCRHPPGVHPVYTRRTPGMHLDLGLAVAAPGAGPHLNFDEGMQR